MKKRLNTPSKHLFSEALQRVFFPTARATLSQDSLNVIEQIASILTQHQEASLIIIGFSDSVGKQTDNFQLSMQRALSVESALLNHGIKKERMTILSEGEAHPIATNSTAEGRAQNRRVDMVIPEFTYFK